MYISELEEYFDNFNNLPCGSSYIKLPWGTKHTDVGYAFEGIELFIDYIKYCERGTEPWDDDDD